MRTPHSKRVRVSDQAFGSSQCNARRSNAPHAFAPHLLEPNDADEIAHAEPATHTSHGTGWQHMIRSRNVVSCGLRRELVEKNRARMSYFRRERRRNREMLRRNLIG